MNKLKLNLNKLQACFILSLTLISMSGCDFDDIDSAPDHIGIGGNNQVVSYQLIDHNIAALSSSQVASARAARIYLEHASVGNNISGGLDDLQSGDSSYDRSNFDFHYRGNPGWQEKIDGLYDRVTGNTPAASDYDALTMKYCYIDAGAQFTYYRDRMLALEALYPGAIFIWWTMPITSGGNSDADAFNTAVRNYCRDNNKILFDIADIECHSPAGLRQTNAGGYEVMFGSYSDDGGHLNTAGRQRVALAFWQLAYVISQL